MNPNTNSVDCRTLRTHMYFNRFSPLEEKVTQFRVERSDDQRSGPVPRKMVKFNPGLSQISSMVFSSKNLQLEVTIYCSVFTTRYSNNNTKCYPKQCIGT